jgi:hypothetical protein
VSSNRKDRFVHMAQTSTFTDNVVQATVNDEHRNPPSVLAHSSDSAHGHATMEVDGVTGGFPETADRHDADIERAAKQLLGWAAAVPRDAVVVVVENQIITLTGIVTWAFQSDAAARAVSDLRGVRAVRNAVTVTKPASTSMNPPGVVLAG